MYLHIEIININNTIEFIIRNNAFVRGNAISSLIILFINLMISRSRAIFLKPCCSFISRRYSNNKR